MEGQMATLSLDTDPEIEKLQIEGLRQMPPWRKVALLCDMNRTLRCLALAGLRQRYPEDSPAQRQRRLADLILGPDVAARAFGPAPEEGP
jgi:hypothetical protein